MHKQASRAIKMQTLRSLGLHIPPRRCRIISRSEEADLAAWLNAAYPRNCFYRKNKQHGQQGHAHPLANDSLATLYSVTQIYVRGIDPWVGRTSTLALGIAWCIDPFVKHPICATVANFHITTSIAINFRRIVRARYEAGCRGFV